MAKTKKDKDDGSDDPEWKLPHPVKAKSKNAGLLAARNKKFKNKVKSDIRCDKCPRQFSDQIQLKNHKKTHGR